LFLIRRENGFTYRLLPLSNNSEVRTLNDKLKLYTTHDIKSLLSNGDINIQKYIDSAGCKDLAPGVTLRSQIKKTVVANADSEETVMNEVNLLLGSGIEDVDQDMPTMEDISAASLVAELEFSIENNDDDEDDDELLC
jgi:hypothetical protein